MEKPKLLIVDDDESIRKQLKWALKETYEILQADDRASALRMVSSKQPSLVTLDLGLPPFPDDVKEGFAVLEAILEQGGFTKVILLTGRDQRDNAIKAIGLGAYDFLCKPVQLDELRMVLRRALYVSQLESEHAERDHRSDGESFEGMLGVSAPMQEVFARIRKVAPTDVAVLILGESGTGKELAARAIHNLSRRKSGPFEAINCGAIPETLLESELFGHEKGAFTGAHTRVKGRIESARGGTLFLDEIGDLTLALQVKLLRYLQERVIERVGGREKILVDARVLAATNMDVPQAMQDGRFREDLYHRLSVVTLSMPPLRERAGDVELLSWVFLDRYLRETRKRLRGFSRQALQLLQAQLWPGNVRELENRIKRAVIMAEGRFVTPADLELAKPAECPAPGRARAGGYGGLGLKQAREELERELISQALEASGMNVSKAAAELGISRPALYELMEKLGIRK